MTENTLHSLSFFYLFCTIIFAYSRKEFNSHGFVWQISAPATDKILATFYVASYFLFAFAQYLLTQNCVAPFGIAIFDGFSRSELQQGMTLQNGVRRKMQKLLAAGRVSSILFGYNNIFVFTFWNQIRENKANNSHTRRNNTQSHVLRCQDKRQALRP